MCASPLTVCGLTRGEEQACRDMRHMVVACFALKGMLHSKPIFEYQTLSPVGLTVGTVPAVCLKSCQLQWIAKSVKKLDKCPFKLPAARIHFSIGHFHNLVFQALPFSFWSAGSVLILKKMLGGALDVQEILT